MLHFFLDIYYLMENSTSASDNLSRQIDSFGADLIHGVSRRKVITAKHFLLALGLHNLTGKKEAIVIINKLGHCINYDKTCDIETAQAEVVLKQSAMVGILPHLPQAEEIILTTFWVDNFDMTIDKQCGAGAVNTTHLVAFQESAGLPNTINITIPRSKKQELSVLPSTNHPVNKISVSIEPQKFVEIATESSFDKSLFESLHCLRLYLRKQNAYDQILPIFSGWLVRQRMKEIPKTALKKTTETYLPPITSKVTDFETMSNYITYLKSLASECNMPYVI